MASRRTWRPQPVAGIADRLILFDGECVLCSWWAGFVIARDPQARFRFAAVQNPLGRALADRLGIDAGNPETNAVILEGRAYFKSDATIRVLASLPGWWWLRPLLLLLPRPLRDRAYDWIARNRYRLFGRRESCLVAAPELARRVVFDEPPAG
jgi:predicted DCC family thiol-disulfide oxidoreductase YuxK